jgi:hypothetical protein
MYNKWSKKYIKPIGNFNDLTNSYQKGGNVAITPEDYKLGILKGKNVFKYNTPGLKHMTMNTPIGTVPYPIFYKGYTNNQLTDIGIAYPGEDFTVNGDTVIEYKLSNMYNNPFKPSNPKLWNQEFNKAKLKYGGYASPSQIRRAAYESYAKKRGGWILQDGGILDQLYYNNIPYYQDGGQVDPNMNPMTQPENNDPNSPKYIYKGDAVPRKESPFKNWEASEPNQQNIPAETNKLQPIANPSDLAEQKALELTETPEDPRVANALTDPIVQESARAAGLDLNKLTNEQLLQYQKLVRSANTKVRNELDLMNEENILMGEPPRDYVKQLTAEELNQTPQGKRGEFDVMYDRITEGVSPDYREYVLKGKNVEIVENENNADLWKANAPNDRASYNAKLEYGDNRTTDNRRLLFENAGVLRGRKEYNEEKGEGNSGYRYTSEFEDYARPYVDKDVFDMVNENQMMDARVSRAMFPNSAGRIMWNQTLLEPSKIRDTYNAILRDPNLTDQERANYAREREQLLLLAKLQGDAVLGHQVRRLFYDNQYSNLSDLTQTGNIVREITSQYPEGPIRDQIRGDLRAVIDRFGDLKKGPMSKMDNGAILEFIANETPRLRYAIDKMAATRHGRIGSTAYTLETSGEGTEITDDSELKNGHLTITVKDGKLVSREEALRLAKDERAHTVTYPHPDDPSRLITEKIQYATPKTTTTYTPTPKTNSGLPYSTGLGQGSFTNKPGTKVVKGPDSVNKKVTKTTNFNTKQKQFGGFTQGQRIKYQSGGMIKEGVVKSYNPYTGQIELY